MGFVPKLKAEKETNAIVFFLLEASKLARNQYNAIKRAKVQKFASKSDI